MTSSLSLFPAPMSYDLQNPDVMKLFDINRCVNVCAPMVRYSKLAFRMLVRKYNCNLAFTPMIVAHSFIESAEARKTDFVTVPEDRPLIVQFASKDGIEFANAAELVFDESDGVDINCGCPQRWAVNEGYGACLLEKPDIVQDMIRQVKNKIYSRKFTVSIKIRIHKDIKKSVELCRRAEKAGLSFISIHGRTKEQGRHGYVDRTAIKTIKESMNIPIIANGDVYDINDVTSFQLDTKADGVMAARGILENPTIFVGTVVTTNECLDYWTQLTEQYKSTFTTFHQHLIFMLERRMSYTEKKLFNFQSSYAAVIEHLESFKMRH